MELAACVCANATVIILSNINLILFYRKNSCANLQGAHTHAHIHTYKAIERM